jgi:hypothetical protein
MSIVNKRNAVIGWATWTTVKRLAAMKAKRSAPPRNGGGSKGKGKKAVKVVAVVAAAGGAVAFWKAKHRDATDYDSIASEEIRVGSDAETTE